MPFIVLSAILQIACIAHAVRTGRVQYWPIIILIGSFVGCLAYFLVEILPEMRNSRATRRVVANVARAIDPEKRKREIAAQLEVADTVQNRIRLAEECLQLGDYQNARVLYERCLSGPYADDPSFLLGRAHAESGLGLFAETRATLEHLIARHPDYKSNDGHLLYATTLEALGESAKALDEYRVLELSYPGEEARLRYARLLAKTGRLGEARDVYQGILKREKTAPAYYRKKEREFFEAAKREIGALGQG
ncbi:MAG: hypothetical protein HYV17_05560 [Xanthomonadales bacterium]|nr:hypothetical protein [Xanthomonadales bacterium]